MSTGSAACDALIIAFRDYITQYVPGSGVNPPAKADIRAACAQLALELAANAVGLAQKDAVAFATTDNIDLAGGGLADGTTHDGVLATTGMRAFVGQQTDATQNGIYIVPASGAASRATDMDSGAKIINSVFSVTSGTTFGAFVFRNSNADTIALGTTDITFGTFLDMNAFFTGVIQPMVDQAQDAQTAAEAAQAAAEAVSDFITYGVEQFNYYSDADMELWPMSRNLVVDSDGRIAKNYYEYTGYELELWDDQILIVDGDGRIAYRSNPYADPFQNTDYASRTGVEVSAFYPDPVIAGVGHSMVAQGQAAAIAAALGDLGVTVTSLNFGRSSNTARGICARMNAYYPEFATWYPVYLPSGGSIPATTTAVTLVPKYLPNGGAIDAGPWESYGGVIPTVSARSGSFAGIPGTFTCDSTNGVRFTRATAGSALTVSDYNPIVLDVRDGGDAPTGDPIIDYRQKLWVIWLDRNSIADETRSIGYARALLHHLATMNIFAVILPDFPDSSTDSLGTSARETLDAWNALLRKNFPNHYCMDEYGTDWLDWCIAQGTDATAKTNGLIDPAWHATGDTLHLSDTGRALSSPFVAQYIIRKNYLRSL